VPTVWRMTIVLYQRFVFSSRRRHTRSKRDWSSDVCSSDLIKPPRYSFGNTSSRPRAFASTLSQLRCSGYGRMAEICAPPATAGWPRSALLRLRPDGRDLRSSGYGGNDRDLRRIRGRGREPVCEPDVLVSHVDVDEPPKRPALVQHSRLQTRV